MHYETFRQFADSWGLLYMLAICLGVCILLFRPGARKEASDAAQIPFRDDR